MMKIDRLELSDIVDALRLSEQAGWNQLEADWRRLLTVWPNGCFAGRLNGKLVATSTLATYGTELGWVGMVLVDESYRGQGLGGAILDAAIEAAREMGIQNLGLDATDLGRPVYLKRGFVAVGGIDRWMSRPTFDPASRPLATRNPPVEVSADAFGALLEFDRKAAQIDRERLLAALNSEAGSAFRVVGDDGILSAVAFQRSGRIASHIGPVIAESQSEAAAVLKLALQRHLLSANQPIIIDVPRGRPSSWLMSAGFSISRRLTRMVTVPHGNALSGPMLFAASGFEMG